MLKIDTKDVVRTVLGTIPKTSVLRALAKNLGDAARAEWIRLAGANLRSSSQDYIDHISQPSYKKDGFLIEMSLEGAMPNMLENGWPGGDMRAFLLGPNAKNSRMSKDGFWYNIVPFRHGTPGTKGRNVGRPMNKKVYSVAKNLTPGQRLDHRKMVDPAVAKIIKKKLAKHHAVGIYQGMQKDDSGYTTFRVISQKNPRGWIHPGIQARRLAGQVRRFVGDLAPHLIDDMIGKT